MPHTVSKSTSGEAEVQKQEEAIDLNVLSNQVGMKIVSSIPCYCDIQFLKKGISNCAKISGSSI
jgi:hypothetical protein